MITDAQILIIFVAFLTGAALIGLVVWLIRRNGGGNDDIQHLIRELDARNQELTGRLSQLSEDSRKAQAELSKAVQDRLDKVGARMGQSLEQAATKTAKSMGEIQTRLSVIDKAQQNIMDLSGEIVGLQNILSNKQARGAFGEVQLKDLVQSILPPKAYKFQAKLSNGKMADCLIKLPNPPGPIVVDAKFPLESFHNLMKEEDKGRREKAGRIFASSILKHVDDISNRYIISHETAESALMFLPSETVYAELYANFPEVVEKSYRKKVWIVSPTTLMATLNTVRAVLMDVKMREQAGLIQREVQKVMEDIIRLDHRVSNLSNHFSQAEKDVREIQISTNKITSRGKRIRDVRLEEDEDVEKKIAPHRDKPKIVKG